MRHVAGRRPLSFASWNSAYWALRLRLLRLLRFLISSAYLDCRLRLLWFRSACSRSLWGLVLGLALVLIYDENRMGGVVVFIIMFSFMIRVAPPRRDPLQPGAAHHPVHSLCSRLLPWCHDIVPCAARCTCAYWHKKL